MRTYYRKYRMNPHKLFSNIHRNRITATSTTCMPNFPPFTSFGEIYRHACVREQHLKCTGITKRRIHLPLLCYYLFYWRQNRTHAPLVHGQWGLERQKNNQQNKDEKTITRQCCLYMPNNRVREFRQRSTVHGKQPLNSSTQQSLFPQDSPQQIRA